VLIPIGIFLVRKFDKDRKKDKILHVDTGETEERSTKEDESIDILKQRYAKGEITKEEFERMKKDLGNS